MRTRWTACHHQPVADVDRRGVDADQHLAVADERPIDVLGRRTASEP